MRNNVARGLNGCEKEFLDIFRELCYSRQPWEVWADVVTVMACSLANSVDKTSKRNEKREEEYADCIKRLKGVDKPAQLFAIVVNALEVNPDQDFLGKLYMTLDLGNHWKGQFFTPYNVSRVMAEMTMGDCQAQIDKQGWISICDPCVGGGAMIIAAANTLRRQKVNYQNHVLFVGQDIDRVVAMMAYIQISLLGCPGYIVVGNSLSNPIIGSALMPAEQEGQEFWYTPFYCSQVWHFRRVFSVMDKMFQNQSKMEPTIRMRGGFLFQFDDEGGIDKNVV